MSRATVIIRTHADRAKVARWASNVAEGTTVEFRERRRNADQSALMWVLLGHIAKQVEWYGVHLSSEDWKDVLTASLRKARVVPGIDPGTFVPLGMRTSQMTIPEMVELIEIVYAFGAQHGVVFGDEARAA
jgi:hypothetical protein